MKIATLVSGGVDSSVALALLKEQGHDITAFYIKIWLEDELAYLGGKCPWEEDLKYARAVCEKLDVPLEVISLQREYWNKVVDYTIAELKAGRTPNPDMLCNQRIKFGEFFKHIDDSFEKVASGHYAQTEKLDNTTLLKKSPDPIKDQTYFLSYLKQEQLARSLFPIGAHSKSEIRKIAQTIDLPTKDRKDSQGICFLGQVRFSEFVKHHLGTRKGNLVDIKTNETVGEHEGYWYFTIGQRHGIKLNAGPWYVIRKDIKTNTVYIGHKEDLPKEPIKSFQIEEINWNTNTAPKQKKLGVRIRHIGEIHPAIVETKTNKVSVHLETPLYDIAPGQFAALYDNEYCLGGGIMVPSTN